MNNSVLGVELTDRCTLLLGVVAVITVWLYLPAAGGPQLLDDRHVIGPLLEAGAQAEPWQAHLLSPHRPARTAVVDGELRAQRKVERR